MPVLTPSRYYTVKLVRHFWLLLMKFVEYSVRSSGRIIKDPIYVTSWFIHSSESSSTPIGPLQTGDRALSYTRSILEQNHWLDGIQQQKHRSTAFCVLLSYTR